MSQKSRSSGYTSKGERNNVSKNIQKTMRKDYLKSGQRLVNQQRAFALGKRVMVTIPNPLGKSATAKPFVRVTAQEAGWKKSEPYRMKQES